MGMQWDKILGAISAALSMVGTYLIWADAQRMTGEIVDILLEVTRKLGTWVDHPWTPQQLEGLKKMADKSGHVNKRGFILLIAGFFLLLVSFFF